MGAKKNLLYCYKSTNTDAASAGSLQNVSKFLRKRGKDKEPESEAASPTSPTLSSPVSPQAMQRRLMLTYADALT
jgi:hypothetical protein